MPRYGIVILGGGMVAGYAAKEYVERGGRPGHMAIVSSDSAPPYERPPLSKGFLAGKEEESSVFINDDTFYRDHGIELRLRTVVRSVDLQHRLLRPAEGEEIGFEKLLLATGAHVRTLDVPGAGLDGILYLRSLDDSKRIRAAAAAARQAVVVGSGFIGMEVASVLAQRGVETTLVFPGERVWQRLFTPETSAFFRRYYEERRVTLASGETVIAFEGDGHVAAAITRSGRRLPADLVVGGVGVMPATDIFRDTGLEVDNGIGVNEYLETGAPDVYAAGDVASYHDVIFEKRRRVEHWDNAVEQGKHAARLLAGERVPFVHVPYFFSDVFDLSYEFWGDTEGADRAVHRGDIDGGRFSVWWLKGGRLMAAFVMNRPDEERELAPAWILERRMVSPEILADEGRQLAMAAASPGG
jgi:NADPH-dependent 2,4-dienoyl-CoA reductase/sulfur reductase-like enzyme